MHLDEKGSNEPVVISACYAKSQDFIRVGVTVWEEQEVAKDTDFEEIAGIVREKLEVIQESPSSRLKLREEFYREYGQGLGNSELSSSNGKSKEVSWILLMMMSQAVLGGGKLTSILSTHVNWQEQYIKKV